MYHKRVVLEVISYLNTLNASVIIFYYLVIPLNTPGVPGGPWPLPEFSLVRNLNSECKFLVYQTH